MCPRFALLNVQCTVAPPASVIDAGVLPPSQVADVGSQPVTAASETEYVPGKTCESLVFDNVPSESSSRLNEVGLLFPKLLVNVKSWALFGTASFTITT